MRSCSRSPFDFDLPRRGGDPVALYRSAGFLFCQSARRAAKTARLTAFGSLKNSLFTLFTSFLV
nr:MAG TPA: hypothetical protein [Caudoviricetes sp.]